MEEFKLIAKLESLIKSRSKDVLVSIGDDTAVVKGSGAPLLCTVDSLVENVHFDLRYFSAADLGHKALAVNLSDIAAMGGKPRWALVSLGLRKGVRTEFLMEMYRGLLALALKHRVEVVGGNVSRANELFVDVTVIGEAPKRPVLRRGAKAGDLLAVTGFLGGAAGGLHGLQKWGKRCATLFPELAGLQTRPEPRLAESDALQGSMNACIDISDGLASELHHIAKASRVKCVVDSEWIPLHPKLKELARKLDLRAMDLALYGGEDYHLLAAIPPKKLRAAQKKIRALGGNLVVVGEVASGRGVFVRRGGRLHQLRALGHRHQF
ncbi:MAG: thiamine-phosphate kinase [Bdellovibrionaceae bacterium]|nr:thiamine-phosphate kinase [Pseudobdellovibrionaceae bacterium]